jgi:hypothetical protein
MLGQRTLGSDLRYEPSAEASHGVADKAVSVLLLRGCGALRGTCRAGTQVQARPTASSNRCEAPL